METGEEGYLLNYWIILLGREQEGHVHYKKKKKKKPSNFYQVSLYFCTPEFAFV